MASSLQFENCRAYILFIAAYVSCESTMAFTCKLIKTAFEGADNIKNEGCVRKKRFVTILKRPPTNEKFMYFPTK